MDISFVHYDNAVPPLYFKRVLLVGCHAREFFILLIFFLFDKVGMRCFLMEKVIVYSFEERTCREPSREIHLKTATLIYYYP